MSLNRIKLLAIGVIAVGILAVVSMRPDRVGAASYVNDDAATTFKAKCVMCHTATVSKFFDPSRPEDEMIQAILKGKKGEKPPYMPAFEEKGITADMAKDLAAYMKQVKSAGN